MFEFRVKSLNDTNKLINKNLRKNILLPFSSNKIFKEIKKNEKTTLNIHTPFCDTLYPGEKDYKISRDNELSNYLTYLLGEIDKLKKNKVFSQIEIEHLNFSGISSSIYSNEDLLAILKRLKSNFKFVPALTFTFESSLESLTDEKLEILIDNGLTHLTLNIYTFSQSGREKLNLTLTNEEIINKIRDIKEKYSIKIKTNIIYNYPEETIDEVLYDAQILSELEIDSINFRAFEKQITKTLPENSIAYDFHLRNEKELHDKFLEKIFIEGYRFHSFTDFAFAKKDNPIKNSDIISIGIDGRGAVGKYEYFNKNKLLSFYIKNNEFTTNLKKLISVLDNLEVELTDLRKLIGDEIYPEIMTLLYEFQKDGVIQFGENIFAYTADGLFWGDTIIYMIIAKIIEYKYMK